MSDSTTNRIAWSLLTRELNRQRRALAFLAGWSVVESMPALLSGVAIAAALDRGFLAGRPLAGLGWLGLLGMAMVVQAAAIRGSIRWLADIVEPIRDALVLVVIAGALRRTVHGHERADSAAVARLSGQVESVRNLMSALLLTLRPTVASLALALVGLISIAPFVAAITAPLILLSLTLFGLSMRVLNTRQRQMLLAEETMARSCADVFGGLRDVVACGAEDTAHQEVDRTIVSQAQAVRAMARASSSRFVILALGADLPVVLVVLLAPWLLRSGRMSAGELVGAATYLLSTMGPALRSLTSTVATWGRQLGVLLQRIADETQVPSHTKHRGRAKPRSGDLSITGLTFAYGPRAEPIVNELSLYIPNGEHLAIVGTSGIGKSTLAALLTGLLRPQAGIVSLGGVPLEQIGPNVLRHSMALIPQEAYVFTGTLRDNLDYLNLEATTADLDRAVAALGIGALVERIGGYDGRLGIGGAPLSSGERQLIALARIYVAPTLVVVLDEATCHLDPISEATAERAFAATGRTLIVIAHRISSVRRAQRILLMDGASAVAGTHHQLLATSSHYADLVVSGATS